MCSTSLENVSVSLLASIMQYKAVSSQIPAIKWGKEKEEVAAAEYFRFAAPRHDNLTMSFAGLVLHPGKLFDRLIEKQIFIRLRNINELKVCQVFALSLY